MGRTVALKLTDREERIVNRLNRAGVTNSEILRDALWRYFKTVTEEEDPLSQTLNPLSETPGSPVMHEYITHLKEEIHQLRDQNISFQKQIGEEISRLHGQIYRISRGTEPSRLIPPNRKRPEMNTDLHRDIDDFLLNKLKEE
jgi:hypothetical protein